MKSIFTYPSNSSTNYIDPLYDGADNTEGYNRRIDQLRTGTYKSWTAMAPTETTAGIMAATSKYQGMLQHLAPSNHNLAIKTMYDHPILEHTMKLKESDINRIEVKLLSGIVVILVTFDSAHGIVNSDTVAFAGLSDVGGLTLSALNDQSLTMYAKVENSTQISLYGDSGLTSPFEIDGIHRLQDDFQIFLDTADGNNAMIEFNKTENYVDGDSITVRTAPTGFNGTAATVGQTYYMKQVGDAGGSRFALYTDSGLTTAATITNQPYYTDAGSLNILHSTNVTNYHITTAVPTTSGWDEVRTFLDDYCDTIYNFPGTEKTYFYANMFIRQNTGSSSTVVFNSLGKQIPQYDWLGQGISPTTGTVGHQDDMVVLGVYDNSTNNVFYYEDWNLEDSDESAWTPLKITVTGADSSNLYTIHVQELDTVGYENAQGRTNADLDSGVFFNGSDTALTGSEVSGLNPIRIEQGPNTGNPYYMVDEIKVYSAGDKQYGNRTSETDPKYSWNPRYADDYWVPAAFDTTDYYNPKQLHATREAAPTMLFTEGTSFRIGGVPAFTRDNQRGQFEDNISKCFEITRAADSYIPNVSGSIGKLSLAVISYILGVSTTTLSEEGATTEAQEDVFDTNDEFTDTGFNDGRKAFPDTVTPKSIRWEIIQPSSTTNSQSGVKYVRSAGYSRYRLDVDYQALTATQFSEIWTFIQAVKGQFNPFYFNLTNTGLNNYNIGDGLFNNPSPTQGLHIVSPVTAGDSLILIGGFASNQADVFNAGELIIAGSQSNGGLAMVVNTTDANIYGEAKIRIAQPSSNTLGNTQFIYQNPAHIIVSLDNDNFSYTQDTDGLYKLSVSFIADTYKGS